MRAPVIVFILCIGLLIPAHASFGIEAEKESGNLALSIKSISFFKNNEYSNPLIEGYTLTGYFVQPEMVYQPSEKVVLQAGAHLLKYSGTNSYATAKPVFSVTYKLSDISRFVMGSLPGSNSHRMFDPHFNKERVYTENTEEGVGFTLQNDNLFTDTWLSWENYIFKDDGEREIFTAGESFRYSSPVLLDWFHLEIPLQILVKHYGGQISDYPEPVETYYNTAAGIRMYGSAKTKKLFQTGFETLLFHGGELSGKSLTGIKNGNAWWFRLFCKYSRAELEAGYWTSHNYYSPNGNFIFGSVSSFRENTLVRDRKMLTFSASLDLVPEDFLGLYFGFDAYYDTVLKKLDHALTLHLRFDKLIRLADIKS